MNICNLTSSIVRIVSSRTDRQQKRKNHMFMTSNNSTMSIKLVEDQKDSSKNNDSSEIEYCGRLDYTGMMRFQSRRKKKFDAFLNGNNIW